MEAGTTTIQITMPEMGESVTEGTILEWLKQVGDEVELDEGIAEVSAAQGDAQVPPPRTVEVSPATVDAAGPSPPSRLLTKTFVEPDETVPVGTVLGEISPSG